MERGPTIFIVEDDAAVRRWLEVRLSREGYQVEGYPDARQFLDGCDLERRGCVLLDVRMPEMDGFELQQTLLDREVRIPVIFLTGYGSVDEAVDAMKSGAFDFLQKPISSERLVAAVRCAIEADTEMRQEDFSRAEVEEKLTKLSPRERVVLGHLVKGKPSKRIALDLDVTDHTIRKQRVSILRKMEASSVAELARYLSVPAKDDTE